MSVLETLTRLLSNYANLRLLDMVVLVLLMEEERGSKGLGWRERRPSGGCCSIMLLGCAFSLSGAMLNMHWGGTGSSSMSRVKLSLLLWWVDAGLVVYLVEEIAIVKSLLICSFTLVTCNPFSI